MKIKNLISIFTGLILSASCMVNASLIEADFLGTNDGFYDTETELYWVDVNQFSAGTIDDMAAQANLARPLYISELIEQEYWEDQYHM